MRKGQTNNPKGRPKGTPNKVTTELRVWIAELIDGCRDELSADLRNMEPAERWRLVERLMAYVLPKVSPTTVREQIEAEYQAVEKLLRHAPDQVVDVLEQRIVQTFKLTDYENQTGKNRDGLISNE
ncbi:MAG: hypothetical protein K2G93_00660 [Rikenella sp.]|nr:hypothetical protein [Rikenella sp.]